MRKLMRRTWVPDDPENYVLSIADAVAREGAVVAGESVERLIAESRRTHERDCINLNPASNVLSERAERALAARLGSRPSLGYPGAKHEMGLEAIEKIEVIAAELAAEVFGADFVELRVASGSIANLYAFMALTKPGDHIITPPTAIGGHVTHHKTGAAGLCGLHVHDAPIDADGYTVNVAALRDQAREVRPTLITLAGSLNLFSHPIREIRAIADEVGAKVLYDAAHVAGLIAAGVWQHPLEEGAHLITMSTYKSLAGPASGLILTNEAHFAERLDSIAFPGLTANFDVAKTASLAITLADWQTFGRNYGKAMCATAKALARELFERGLPVFGESRDFTASHQLALHAAPFGGGLRASRLLRRANILVSAIGLPIEPVAGDANGIRIGTPEIVRWGMGPEHMPQLATFISETLLQTERPETIAEAVTRFRQRFSKIHFAS